MQTQVVALCGGVGGARFLDGLAQLLPPERLTAIVNTGDDFRHWGLWISPDIDTCMYTLAGLAPEERGWGLVDESFHCHERMSQLGGERWFQLGDRDLAVHLRRNELLANGATLTNVTLQLSQALGVLHPLLPMSDSPRQTFVETREQGTLSFQEWLVQHRGTPRVAALEFRGSTNASPHVIRAIEAADLVLIAPSNPYVSIDPILTLDGVAEAIGSSPVVAVSPIIAGRAVKGPLAQMIPDLAGVPASAQACVEHYRQALPMAQVCGVVHRDDAIDGPGLQTDILMKGRQGRARLAGEVLRFGADLASTSP